MKWTPPFFEYIAEISISSGCDKNCFGGHFETKYFYFSNLDLFLHSYFNPSFIERFFWKTVFFLKFESHGCSCGMEISILVTILKQVKVFDFFSRFIVVFWCLQIWCKFWAKIPFGKQFFERPPCILTGVKISDASIC